MSDIGLPQSFVIDLGANQVTEFETFGFKCSRAFNSNPSHIELKASPDGKNFKYISEFRTGEMKKGYFIFPLKQVLNCKAHRYIEIKILSTFGANRTYLTQILLLEKEA
jgi:hypothetical protein